MIHKSMTNIKCVLKKQTKLHRTHDDQVQDKS